MKIYSVQAFALRRSTPFYAEMANVTGGYHLHLKKFDDIFDFIMAISYREYGQDFLEVATFLFRISEDIRTEYWHFIFVS